jgi:hypothetical protein
MSTRLKENFRKASRAMKGFCSAIGVSDFDRPEYRKDGEDIFLK